MNLYRACRVCKLCRVSKLCRVGNLCRAFCPWRHVCWCNWSVGGSGPYSLYTYLVVLWRVQCWRQWPIQPLYLPGGSVTCAVLEAVAHTASIPTWWFCDVCSVGGSSPYSLYTYLVVLWRVQCWRQWPIQPLYLPGGSVTCVQCWRQWPIQPLYLPGGSVTCVQCWRQWPIQPLYLPGGSVTWICMTVMREASR